jgi:tRNA(adenine34) deaminase
MCAGAIVWAKVPRVVFGAFDERAGAGGTLYNLLRDDRLNHRCTVVSGVEDEASAGLLRSFFAQRRAS